MHNPAHPWAAKFHSRRQPFVWISNFGMLIYYFLAIFAAFLQSINNFLWWPIIAVVVVASRKDDVSRVYLFSFLTGLLTDLVTGRLLGQSAIYFLLITAAIFLVKSRFEFNWRWVGLFLVLAQVVFKFGYF